MNQSTAVLVIDVQTGLFEGERPVYEGEAVVERISTLVERARQAAVPIVFIQDNDVGEIGGPAWQIHPGLTPQADDLFIRKPYGDSFFCTTLDSDLRARAIQRLVVVGCKTDACVDATCRRAVSLGYDVILAADGHTTSDNRFMDAPRSIEYYNMMLDGIGLEDGFGAGVHSIVVQQAAEISL